LCGWRPSVRVRSPASLQQPHCVMPDQHVINQRQVPGLCAPACAGRKFHVKDSGPRNPQPPGEPPAQELFKCGDKPRCYFAKPESPVPLSRAWGAINNFDSHMLFRFASGVVAGNRSLSRHPGRPGRTAGLAGRRRPEGRKRVSAPSGPPEAEGLGWPARDPGAQHGVSTAFAAMTRKP
jgi:hypothetical protein